MLKYIIFGIFSLLLFSGCSSKTYMSDGKNSVIVKKSNNTTKRVGVLKTPNGHYKGEIQNGMAHGLGIYEWNSGETYEGNYKYGLKNGYGKFTWNDETFYEGNFLNGKRNGKGKQILDEKYSIKGDFRGDTCSGCTYKLAGRNNLFAKGLFKLENSKITPLNVSIKLKDGSYNGETNIDLQPHGKGVKLIKNGTIKIDAIWDNGEISQLLSKTKTNKYFLVMKEKEKCKLIPNGWIYIGKNCKNNLASGYGEAIGFDGISNYIGTFENGTFKKGTYSKNDKKIKGEFANGKVHGKAIVYKGEQITYEGSFRDGYKHGKGVCLYKGEYESCEYFQNKRVDTLYKQRLAKIEEAKKQKELAKQRRTTRNYSSRRTSTYQNSSAGAGSSIKDTVVDCAKGYIAKKACERLPWPANNICMATARSNYPCLNMLEK